MSSTYYDTSYPPSLWAPVVIPATSATAGTPGNWLPAGSQPPANVSALQGAGITAVPATDWTIGQYVQTATAGSAGEANWNGTGWVAGRSAVAVQEASQAPVVLQEATDSPGGTETAQEPPEAPQAP